MDTSRTVGRNIGWADSRILGRHTLRNPDTNQTRNPYRKQTWARDHPNQTRVDEWLLPALAAR